MLGDWPLRCVERFVLPGYNIGVVKNLPLHAADVEIANAVECKDSIVTLIEGGEEAFRKRGKRYQF